MNTEQERHPSYGIAGFFRSQGGNYNLFGSSIQHNNTIHLTVKRAVKSRDLHQDWIHGTEEIVEVRFSPTQFADLLTSMNCGDGVPCTIERVAGETMPPCPEVHKRQEIHDEFSADMQALESRLQALAERASELLDQPKLSKSERDELKTELRRLMQEIRANIPFVVKQFNRQVDRTVTEAKGEVDAAITGMIQRAGIEALTNAIGSRTIDMPTLELKKPS